MNIIPFPDITSALAELTAEEKEDECVSFSMKLRDAWSLQNYRRFFRLYHSAPKMSGYLELKCSVIKVQSGKYYV